MIIKPNMKKMFKKANIASGNTVNIGLAPSGGGMSGFSRLKPNIKEGATEAASAGVASAATGTNVKSNRGSKRFMDAIKQGQEFSKSMKPPLQKSGFNIAAIEAREAGEDSFTYGGKKFPVTKRMKEDGDGMYRMETMTPMNPMGAVPLRRNEMPMAYKQKVVKKTAGAKAVPFTNRNAL